MKVIVPFIGIVLSLYWSCVVNLFLVRCRPTLAQQMALSGFGTSQTAFSLRYNLVCVSLLSSFRRHFGSSKWAAKDSRCLLHFKTESSFICSSPGVKWHVWTRSFVAVMHLHCLILKIKYYQNNYFYLAGWRAWEKTFDLFNVWVTALWSLPDLCHWIPDLLHPCLWQAWGSHLYCYRHAGRQTIR